jgi:predicted nucleic acid-binding protein
MQDIAVFNSSPLINLAKAGKLDILQALFKKCFIPEAVYKELVIEAKNKTGVDEIEKLILNKTLEIKKIKDKHLAKALQTEIDFGESEAIVLAIETKDCVLIIDETEGRRFADLFNLSKTGFIGLLLDAYQKKLISNIEVPLNAAIGRGFWINKKLLKQILEMVKKNK